MFGELSCLDDGNGASALCVFAEIRHGLMLVMVRREKHSLGFLPTLDVPGHLTLNVHVIKTLHNGQDWRRSSVGSMTSAMLFLLFA